VNPTALALPLVLVTVAAGVALQPGARAPTSPVSSPWPPGAEPSVVRMAAAPAETSVLAPEPRGDLVAPASDGRAPRARWTWPLTPKPAVVRRFVPPATRYGAGHRGVDLAASPGQVVRAVDAGTVTHVGRVAGRGTLTVTHGSGLRSTYEPVTASVRRGQLVARSGVVGTVAAGPSHCSPVSCLHLGALRGPAYLDPLRLLAGGRVRLLPLGQAPDG
jgi:murein DD-endopeptidase MepM/ murein hydrolase activator NlpD